MSTRKQIQQKKRLIDIYLISIVIVLVIVLVISVVILVKTPKRSNPNLKKTTSQWISCGCPELQTHHPGRIRHKLKCSKFWKLNPDKTAEELLAFEGFS